MIPNHRVIGDGLGAMVEGHLRLFDFLTAH
jgi:hypothetical protein